MDSRTVKKNLLELTQYIPTELPAMGWYFSNEQPSSALVFEKGKWACMFQYMEQITAGKQLCFSSQLSGCSGAACYLGFKTPSQQAGGFLAEKEKFKKCIEYGEAFYREIQAIKAKNNYLILSRIQDVPENTNIEVVNLWVSAMALTGLVTLANYDSPTNNNVLIPFASGCQSMWTMPYKEKLNQNPKAVVGSMDPAMREYLSPQVLLFSLPSERFVKLAGYIPNSFLLNSSWGELLRRCRSAVVKNSPGICLPPLFKK
ncbi:MAG: DUF169 domain-containing protein [Deltaproteobacteria bacterium]|nr:DUF169 domain-containing protein [Deltaproteobacteria bacterium]